MAVEIYTTHTNSIHVHVHGHIQVDYISVNSLHGHVHVGNELYLCHCWTFTGSCLLSPVGSVG